jgi:amino acid adenylation domain-containing protein
MFTSGSTGKPKCVGITHRGVIRLVRNTDYVQLNSGDRMAQISNLSFDALTFEIWGALLNGAALVGIERDTALNPRQFAQAISRNGINVMVVATALFNQIAYEMPEAFSSLRDLVFGGEAVDVNAVRKVLAAGAPPRLMNGYGPTENTTITSWYLANELSENAVTVPIGMPIANTTIYVLDAYFQLAPAGAIGELYTGGDGLARGYLGCPDLTAEKFIPNPFSTAPGERLYRTGDLARLQPNGLLEFVARNDQQVKFRGFRIELAEIEASLRECVDVREAIVMLREDSPGDKKLVAYVTAANEIPGSQLRIHLAERLPEYMVPADFVYLERFPLTPNGKVDRKALPAPQRSRDSEAHVPPRTTIEQMLANIWTEVLRVERISVHDNFFELGGHSLLAMRVISRIRETLAVEVTVRQLFEQRTIASLAQGIDAEVKQSGHTHTLPLVPVERHGDMPLSFAQQRMWLLYQFESDQSLYNIPIAIRFTGMLQAVVLTRAVNEILRRHESLRTSFRAHRGTPFQVINPHEDIELPFRDLSGHAPEEREAQVTLRIKEQMRTPFDLSCAPLLRGELLHLSSDENVLVLVLHHITVDGWSLGIFSKELTALYEAFAASQKPLLPELPVQYADYAIWQRQWLQSGVEERQFEYWKKQLAQMSEPLELPIARLRPVTQSHCGAEYDLDFPLELLNSLRVLSRKEGVTLFMIMVAAFQVLLYRYTRQTDIVLGTPIAGRSMREIEDLIGFFVNTLVLRVDLSGNPSFAGLLKRVREVTLAAYANQDIPFERLVEKLLPERDLSRSPLFQIMFALQNAPAAEWLLSGLTLKQQRVELGVEKFDLTVTLTEHGQGLRVTFDYNTELFEENAIREMADHYRTLLLQSVASPSQCIDELPLLTATERQQILLEQEHTIVPYEREQCVQQLFENQAERTPEAIALAFAGEQLTYQQLNQKANQMAHYLRRLGVGPESAVGLFIERSLEMMIGLLGIVKAGGAYVPLDPEYPVVRLKGMIGDSNVSVLLTQSKLRNVLAESVRTVICLDNDWPAISAESLANPEHLTTSENLIYTMYTSGSTGQPKGTAVPHRGVVRLVRNTNYAQFGSGQVFLQFAPISFDASTLEIWGSLLHGARLEIMPPEMPSFESLGEAIVQRGVTVLWLTAGLFHQMVDHQLEALQSVRQLLAGGDVLSPSHVKRLLEKNKETQLINGYGPTENTTFTCCYSIPQSFAADTVPIGAAIANTQVYVLDRDMQLVPTGMTGELYTGGDGLARGYLNRPELTAGKFVPDPFGSAAGQRLYRTGDLVKRRRDGALEFIGRVDDQVKIRGFRIEPREIEAVLSEQEGIEAAAVAVQSDASETKRLVACVVPKTGRRVKRAELRSALKQRLPEYMIPGVFVVLNSLPLTPNGKVDRNALAKSVEEVPVAEEFTAPRTPVEELLAAIWSEVLKTDCIGVHDNFFETGGHSLMAMQIVSRLQEIFPVTLPLRVLFECPTIAELAVRLVSHELKPGLTLKIAEALNNAQKNANQEPQFFSRSTA